MTKLFSPFLCIVFCTLIASPAMAAISYIHFGSGIKASDNGGVSGQTQSIAVDINLNSQSITTSKGIGITGNRLTLTPEDHWITGSFPDLTFNRNSGKLRESQNTDIVGSNLSEGMSYGGGKFVCGSLFGCIDNPSEKNISGTHVNQYRGFRMRSGTKTYSGWFKFSMDQPVNGTSYFTLQEIAVEFTQNKAIVIGDTGTVPEPSTTLLSALGLSCIMLRRGRKTAH